MSDRILQLDLTDRRQGHVAVATVETVTRRFFRSHRRERHFVCTRTSPIMGGEWLDTDSHEPLDPSDELSRRLNHAAQAKAHLLRRALGEPTCRNNPISQRNP